MGNFNSKFNFVNFSKFNQKKKQYIVNNIFSSVHNKYDIMNDIMSFGLHRIWKKTFIESMSLRKNMKVLDLACGTCDLAKPILKKIEVQKNLFMLDLNHKMLKIGKRKCIDNNITNANIIQGDIHNLPFKDNYFDIICISFGFRNVMNKNLALKEIYRCLKIGGKFSILEFSKPKGYFFNKLYDFYLFNYITNIGKFISIKLYSYEYLSKSIKKHPDQNTLKKIMQTINFYNVSYTNLSNGIVAIHNGYKCY